MTAFDILLISTTSGENQNMGTGPDKVRRIGINPLDRRDFLTKARSVIRANKVLVNSIYYADTNQNKINRKEVFCDSEICRGAGRFFNVGIVCACKCLSR